MTDPQVTFQFHPVPTAVMLIVTAVIAYFLGRRLERWTAVLAAGLAAPALLIAMGIFHAATAADDFPPGLILAGFLVGAAATSSLTLVVSYFVVGYARR
jgi:hypothetical protein